MIAIERDRHRHRDRDRDKEIQTQTDRETDSEAERQAGRQTGIQTDGHHQQSVVGRRRLQARAPTAQQCSLGLKALVAMFGFFLENA